MLKVEMPPLENDGKTIKAGETGRLGRWSETWPGTWNQENRI